ncbi:MAG TPA: PEP-utilizing enzyme [Candidatus Nanoarchaeia archaeon]|nr:PEP-utilizing enzyme [Candidatus Nanoarchaeia archaeon]
MIDPNTEIFKWGPIPAKYYFVSEYFEICSQRFGEEFSGERWPDTLVLFKDDKILWINEFPALRQAGKEAFFKYMSDQKVRENIYLRWLKRIGELNQFQDQLLNKDLTKLSTEELKNVWFTFFEKTIHFWNLTIPAELAGYGSEEILKEELKKYISNEDQLRSALEILAAPEKSSFYQEEEIELAETKDILNHQKKYFWLQNSYARTKVLSTSFFKERKDKLKPDLRERTKERINLLIQEKKDLIQELKLPPKVMDLTQTVSEIISWQDERKKHIFINLHYKDLLLKEIVRRFKYKLDDLLNLSYSEIWNLIELKKISPPNPERKEGFGIFINQTLTNLSPEQVTSLWNTYTQEKISERTTEFTGTTASKGKNSVIQGKVCIIFDPFKSKKFQKGDILVAAMTSPEYVFLMEKAAAIVTDAGGLTCHAAIVSREFGLPCIVGTKIATQVLHDGDLVEVDANKGIVKILKKV